MKVDVHCLWVADMSKKSFRLLASFGNHTVLFEDTKKRVSLRFSVSLKLTYMYTVDEGKQL